MKPATPKLGSRFDAAIVFAHALHRDQRRKGRGVPYLGHLLAVAATVIDYGGDEEAAIAALLHDAVEDQGGMATLARIRERFGDRVAEVVLGVSDSTGEPKRPWVDRKVDYIIRVLEGSPRTKLVAAADKLHNLRCTVADVRSDGPRAMLKFSAPAGEVLDYYDGCLRAVRGGVPEGLAAELGWALAELRMLLAMPATGRPPH